MSGRSKTGGGRPRTIGASVATCAKARAGAGVVRIVAGRWRRTPIVVLQRDGLRPTPERVRETVFDWLAHLVGPLDGAEVLDMFAGSGAMGFEAASRGAKTLFIDRDPAVVGKIEETIKKLCADDVCRAVAGDAFAVLSREPGPYDFIVIDPPYADERQLDALSRAKEVLAPNGLLYVEHPDAPLAQTDLDRLGLVAVRSARAGQVVYALLAHASGALAKEAKPWKEKLSKVERAKLRRMQFAEADAGEAK